MKYDAVIFDLLGTLVSNFSRSEHEKVLSEMAAIVEAPRQDFIRRWFETFDQRATGILASTEDNIECVCRSLQLSPNADAMFRAAQTRVAFTRSGLVPRPDALVTLARLKAMGHKLGLITDCSSEVPAVWNDSPLGVSSTSQYSPARWGYANRTHGSTCAPVRPWQLLPKGACTSATAGVTNSAGPYGLA